MKNEINISLFLQEWKKIEQKLEQIDGMSPLFNGESDFEGVEIQDDGIMYKKECYYSGCGRETSSFFIAWDDINKPIEYFQSLCDAEILKRQEEKAEAEVRKLEEIEKKERKLLAELKQKYD